MSSKMLLPLSLIAVGLLAAGNIFSFAAPVAVRLPAESDEEVIRYAEQGVPLQDVEIGWFPAGAGERIRVLWAHENQYVTAVIDDSQLADFASRFTVLESFAANPETPSSGAGELDDPEELEASWGWPRRMQGFPAVSFQVPTLADLDGSGDLEIVLNTLEGYIYAWQHSGAFVPGYPLEPADLDRPATWASSVSWETGAAVSLNGDGREQVIYGASTGIIFATRRVPRNTSQLIWKDIGTGVFTGVPAAYDLNGDGREELILHTYNPGDDPPQAGTIHTLDDAGQDIDGWPVVYDRPTVSSPVVGDIDGDGEVEIVVGYGQSIEESGGLIAWNSDGTVLNGWPVDGFHTINSTPILADVNGDDVLEVIVRCKEIGGVNGIFAFDGGGDIVDGFPIEVDGGHPYGSVAVGDIDGNGILDFAVGTVGFHNGCKVLVYEQGAGLREGFPAHPGGYWVGGSPIFADVTGDGNPEVIVSRRQHTAINRPRIAVYDADGRQVAVAYQIEDDPGQFPSSPTAWDIDGDGLIEIIAASSTGRLYVWDTDGIPGTSMFPCEKGDFARTGVYRAMENGPLNELPAYNDSQLPGEFLVTGLFPNPFNAGTTIRVELPRNGHLELKVFNLLGEQVETLVDGHRHAGEYRIRWSPKMLPSGMYYLGAEFEGTRKMRKIIYMK